MPFLHLIILAIVQGITEFLPVSSSAHLVIFHNLLDHRDEMQNLLFDIAVHLGTLLAVILCFRADIFAMARAVFTPHKTNDATSQRRLCLFLILSSVPIIIVGFFLYRADPNWVRSPYIIAWASILFGGLLWISDRTQQKDRTIQSLTVRDALLIGVSQILALIPGTSRSGITMTAGRFLGFSRTEAAKYSLLLGMIAISGAGALGALSIIRLDSITFGMDIITGFILSFLAAWIAILCMMRWLARSSFAPFALYRIAIGIMILAILYI